MKGYPKKGGLTESDMPVLGGLQSFFTVLLGFFSLSQTEKLREGKKK